MNVIVIYHMQALVRLHPLVQILWSGLSNVIAVCGRLMLANTIDQWGLEDVFWFLAR